MDLTFREKGLYRFGPFLMDPVRRVLTRNGTPLALTARLFDTLLYLVQNADRLVERDELEQAVWPGRVVEDGNLQKAISSLRKSLQGAGPDVPFIVTVPGRGFRLAVPVVFEPAQPEITTISPVDGVRPWPRRRWLQVSLGSVVILCAAAGGLLMLRGPGMKPIPPAVTAPAPHSVAVLAFTNLSGDPAQEYFSDGLSEELIDSLGRIGALHVAARQSAFSFKGKASTIADIARALNVGAVLEGSVRRDGPRLRITAQLIDAATGFQVWSEHYDRDEGEILNVQTEIAASVIKSLQVKLLGDESARLTLGGTTNPRALDAYLRGLKLDFETSDRADKEALKSFDLAISLDKNFADAYIHRAFALSNIVDYGMVSDVGEARRMLDDAMAAADTGIAIAPGLGIAHDVRANVLVDRDLDFVDAAKEFALALSLEPNEPWTQMRYGLFEIFLNHNAEGLAAAEWGISLDPVNPALYLNLAEILYFARRYDESISALNHGLEFGSNGAERASGLRGFNLLMKGSAAAAEHLCGAKEDILEIECLTLALFADGKKTEGDGQLKTLQHFIGDRGAYIYAEIAAQRGLKVDALQWLETALRLRDSSLAFLKADPLLDNIRAEPRFKAIEQKLHFPP